MFVIYYEILNKVLYYPSQTINWYHTVDKNIVELSTIQLSTMLHKSVSCLPVAPLFPGAKLWSVPWQSVLYSTVCTLYCTVMYIVDCTVCTIQHGTVMYSTVQYSRVQYSRVQYSTVQYSTVQYSNVHVNNRTVMWSTLQFWQRSLVISLFSHPEQQSSQPANFSAT